MQPHTLATWGELPDREPVGALVAGVDIVVVRYDEDVSVLYGRCLHRGALMADGRVDGDDLICGLHDDLTTFDRELHHLAGIPYGGLSA